MLLGGETAEMPGLYKENDFDFAGFCVGAVERKKILPKKNIMKEGDLLFGIKSSGFHSNGYSLIRKVLRDTKVELNSSTDFNSKFKTNAKALMAPTRLYYTYLKKLFETDLLNGISHITGGGIIGNVPRMLPENLSANINKDLFFKDDIFEWFKNLSNISNDEMYKTFNCGLGLVVSIAKENYDQFINVTQNENLEIFEVGLVKLQTL
tara:strand:+ start:19 stop:642 length:624 start_codon:yes stop_codon:yes gene_type:complete